MSEFALKTALPTYLREEQSRIEKLAGEAGLDFFPTVFEILTYDQMNEIAAYGGFPNRYPHWRFGMEYERLAKSYEYGLSKIYEMVINNNPRTRISRGKLPRRPEARHGPRVRARRLLQEQLLLPLERSRHRRSHGRPRSPPEHLRSEPPLDRQDGQPRVAHPARRGKARHQQGRGVSRSLPQPREPGRSARALQRAPRQGRRRGRGRDARHRGPRLRAKDYMESFINPEEYLEEQKKKIEAEREKAKKFPSTRSATSSSSSSTTRRWSAGSARSSRSSARRPTTSRRSGRPRS